MPRFLWHSLSDVCPFLAGPGRFVLANINSCLTATSGPKQRFGIFGLKVRSLLKRTCGSYICQAANHQISVWFLVFSVPVYLFILVCWKVAQGLCWQRLPLARNRTGRSARHRVLRMRSCQMPGTQNSPVYIIKNQCEI